MYRRLSNLRYVDGTNGKLLKDFRSFRYFHLFRILLPSSISELQLHGSKKYFSWRPPFQPHFAHVLNETNKPAKG